jgi:hypothetical protein
MDPTTATSVPPLTAYLTSQPPAPEAPHIHPEEIHLGRDQVPLHPEVWERIDRAVADEVRRTRLATRFLPQRRVGHHITNVEQDAVLQNLTTGSPPFAPPALALVAGPTPPTLNIYEGANLTVIQLSVRTALTKPQVRKENERLQEMPSSPNGHPEYHSSTAVLLHRRAANILCLGVDALVWLGSNAFPAAGGAGGLPIFSSQTVLSNGIPGDTGITCIGGPNAPLEVLTVEPDNAVAPGGNPIAAFFASNLVGLLSKAVTDLAANGYGGPYAAVLPPSFYAKSFFPLPGTLQRPADLIVPTLSWYLDSAILPGVPNPVTPNPGGNPLGLNGLTNPSAQGVGVVLSLGGGVVEFVNGLDPVTAFSQIDGNGNYIFQLITRVANKISDSRGIVRIEFM